MIRSALVRCTLSAAFVFATAVAAQPTREVVGDAAVAAEAPGPGVSAELLYRLLLGDVALQRGEPALAARAYLDAARESRDVRLARRATEIAYTARQRGLAEQAARLWSDLDPADERPRQIQIALASGSTGRDGADEGDAELRGKLERFLADAALGAGVGDAFLQINRLFAQQADKAYVYRLVRDLARPYGRSPEAHFAVGLAAYTAGVTDPAMGKAALEAADAALALRPGWDRAALLKAEILAKGSRRAAIDWLRQFVASTTPTRSVSVALAQLLIEDRRYAEARAIYEALAREHPGEKEYAFGIAAIAMQMKDWAAAEQQLLALKAAQYGEGGVVESYLAQVAEETKRYDEAIARYEAVPEGERAWLAKLRIAAIRGKQGRIDEARRYLADLPAVTIDQRVQVRQAEAQLFRDAGDYAQAYEILGRALAEHPEATDLIYDRAMVAEKLDHVAEAETLLRRLVELRPDDAHSLNALGYTLVDRTTRIDEGFVLIQKAHALAPADAFILDSMGWALYRLGRLDEAIGYLRRAFDDRPDPEIAAHLGEALWAKGEPERAREVWQRQLSITPDNALLQETLRRHRN